MRDDVVERVQLPAAMWRRPEVLAGCRERRAGVLLRVARDRYGVSQERIAAVVGGGMDQGEVGRLIDGGGAETATQECWGWIADAFGMPDWVRLLAGLPPVSGTRVPPRVESARPRETARPLRCGRPERSWGRYEPIVLPDAAWRDRAVLDACEGLDANALFRLVNRRYGVSQERLGHSIDLIDSVEINKRINGRKQGKVEALRRWRAIADGLNMPDHARMLIGLAPTQATVDGLQETCRLAGPDQSNASLVQGTVAADELESWELADALTRSSIGSVVLTEIERAAFGLAGRYPASPPETMLPLVHRQVDRVKQALAQPQPLGIHRRCVVLLGTLSGIAGHLYLDLGRDSQAEGLFAVSRLAGAEAGDDDLAAWATATQSIGPFFAGDHARAVELLSQAKTLATHGSGRRRAWVAGLLARATAAAGSRREALAALDRARTLLSEVTDPPSGNDFFDTARLDGLAGSCYLLLADSRSAVEMLSRALAGRADGDTKGRALLTLDLAACHVIQHEPEEAARLAGTALDFAAGALVHPIVQRATALRASMGRWAGTPALAELDARLAAAR